MCQLCAPHEPLRPLLPQCNKYNSSALQVAEYLEIHGRVQLLNDRFSVMQELLDILRSHAQACFACFAPRFGCSVSG